MSQHVGVMFTRDGSSYHDELAMKGTLHCSHWSVFHSFIYGSYNDVDDEHRATNILITADESFHSIRSRKITVIFLMY